MNEPADIKVGKISKMFPEKQNPSMVWLSFIIHERDKYLLDQQPEFIKNGDVYAIQSYGALGFRFKVIKTPSIYEICEIDKKIESDFTTDREDQIPIASENENDPPHFICREVLYTMITEYIKGMYSYDMIQNPYLSYKDFKVKVLLIIEGILFSVDDRYSEQIEGIRRSFKEKNG